MAVTRVDDGFLGLSTDTKPTEDVECGDFFYELDEVDGENRMWQYSAANINPLTDNGWWEV